MNVSGRRTIQEQNQINHQMPQKGQGLGTNGTCAKDNNEGSGAQKPKRPEEYVNFDTLIYKQTQTLLFPSIHCRTNSWDNFMLLLYTGGVIRKLFYHNSCLEAERCSAEGKATLEFLLD